MQIIRASDMGFCWGVRRAVDMMEQQAAGGLPIISLGSVVHNEQVVEHLRGRGVGVAASAAELSGDRVAITAHGVGPQVLQELREMGKEIIDTTCPIVTRSQRWAKKLADEGFAIVIFGDPNHKEVRGVLQWAGNRGYAITEDEIDSLPGDMPSRVAVLSQTTHNPQRFANFVALLLRKRIDRISDLQMINTLCHATSGQQAAAEELAGLVDIVVVVGGRESANTRHLVEVCQARGVATHHVETESELQPAWFDGRERVGVTAGASTPDFVIDAVIARLEQFSSAVPA
ncbi:MAG: 4-hydroxy-3-methylbut-2-enyl diphosphate reductase [Dehalococcoidia bacterium]|nr:4-hydroxy-3-methylbut-2-enyl diphosphate reductase [Dehalococcoidia bacterium]